MLLMIRRRLLPLLLGTALAGACIDPAEPRAIETDVDRHLVLFAVLDPASPPALVVTTTAVFDPALSVRAWLEPPVGPAIAASEHPQCPYGWVSVAALRCLRFDSPPRPRQEYTIRASAAGYEEVRGSATVPGDFQILSHQADGDPPGSASLAVDWTPSEGAHRYLVAIRATETPRCYPRCRHGWSFYTSETQFDGVVPEDSYLEGEPPWILDVYALDQNLFDYLTTGTSGSIFSVAKASNVQGGYGVVGAWVRRSASLED